MFKKKGYKYKLNYYQPKSLMGALQMESNGIMSEIARKTNREFLRGRSWPDPKSKRAIVSELKSQFDHLKDIEQFQETDSSQLLYVLNRLRKLEDYLGVELKKTLESEKFIKKSKKKAVQLEDDEEDN